MEASQKKIVGSSEWSIQEIWNKQLTIGKDKPMQKRTRIWASEIGKNYFDRFLKMNAVPVDVPYDERTLRVFAAGDFFERIIGYVLITSGLLKYDNKWYNIPESEKHLEVSVKPDFIAGGKPDWNKVKKEFETNALFQVMPVLERISHALVDFLFAKYPNGLNDLLYEIKSINSQVFWSKKDYLQNAYPHHIMQNFTGLKATGYSEGRMLYISKDDLTVAEFPVYLNNDDLEKKWNEDVAQMTYYIRNNITPPKPEPIVFDPKKKIRFQRDKKKYEIPGAWVDNWEVKWSPYFKTITGFTDEDKWLDSISPLLKEKNDAIKEEYIAKNGLDVKVK